jgi:hypothetical protein
MSAVSRFFGAGVRDAERRIAALTASRPDDEPRVVSQLESSAVFGVVSRAVNLLACAYESSALVTMATRLIDHSYTSASWGCRRFSAGVVLVVAAATYVGLYLVQQSPTGWLWLVVPAMAAIIGALLIAASSVSGRSLGD